MRRFHWQGAVSLALAGATLVAFRLHGFDVPLERDECNYAYIAGQLLQGKRLYVDVWDHQPFGVYVLFAGFIALFGDGVEVFRWAAAGASLASLVVLCALVRRLASRPAAVLAAALFALTSSDPSTTGEGGNREVYMNVLLLAAWWLVVSNQRRDANSLRASGGDPEAQRPTRRAQADSAGTLSSKQAISGTNQHDRNSLGGNTSSPFTMSTWRYFLAGGALALASALKTIVVVHWLALIIYILTSSTRNPERSSRTRALAWALAAFALGPAIFWMTTTGYFAATDRLQEYAEAVFGFNVGYARRDEGFLVRFARFATPKPYGTAFESALPLWIAALVSCAWLCFDFARRRRPQSLAVLMYCLSGYLAVCLPGQFWPHYYYLLLPPIIAAVSLTFEHLRKRTGLKASGATALALVGAVAIGEYKYYLSQPPEGITAKRYSGRDFWARAMGETVGAATDPDDSIFVYGDDAPIYYYSKRRCASRFTMLTGLNPAYSGIKQRRRQLIDDLRRDPPRVILVLLGQEPFPELLDFFHGRYDPVGWDYRDSPPHDAVLMVLADRQRPTEPIARTEWEWVPKAAPN